MDDFAEDGFARDEHSDEDFSDTLPGKEAFKEFQGKDLDSAIEEACVYFNAGRERLEIEIVQDAKSGLFGLIGARKAKVHARRARLRDTVRSVLGELHAARPSRSSRRERGETRTRARADRGQDADSGEASKKDRPRRAPQERKPSARKIRDAADAPARERAARGDDARHERRAAPQHREFDKAAPQKAPPSHIADDAKLIASQSLPAGDALPLWDEAAGKRMADIALAWANRLFERLIGRPCAFEVRAEGNLGQVDIVLVPKGLDTPDGLPMDIARDADVMGAVEHLTSRLLSREARLAAKVVIETGEPRERRDDKLAQAAMELARRALAYDKPQATEALSSQDRRIVHVALKEIAGIRTKSLGKGHMRKVLIMPKRAGLDVQAAEEDGAEYMDGGMDGDMNAGMANSMGGDVAAPEATAPVANVETGQGAHNDADAGQPTNPATDTLAENAIDAATQETPDDTRTGQA